VFKISPSGALTPLYSFTGANDGSSPQAPLVLGSDGKFYGTTALGGANEEGTVFQITTNGLLTTLYSFTDGEGGIGSYTALVQGTNGNFYIACEGVPEGYTPGYILRLTVPPEFLSMTATGDACSLTWSGETGQQYQLQCNSTLAPTGWTNLGATITSQGSVFTATDPNPAGSQRFYRLVALP
jgi:uncharacterized repeat protein (TIGR03803 family)